MQDCIAQTVAAIDADLPEAEIKEQLVKVAAQAVVRIELLVRGGNNGS